MLSYMIDIFKKNTTEQTETKPFIGEKIKPIPNMMQMMSKLLMFGFVLILLIGAYAYYLSASSLNAIIVIGAFGFLPIGLVMGGAVIDKSIRCKVLRAMTRRNLGIVNFLSGNEFFSRIKDFDNDVIETKTKIFYMVKGRILNDKGEVESAIDPSAIKFHSGIPNITFDLNTALPLTYNQDKTKIDPSVIAAATKAHVILKEAENLNMNKKVIGISVLALVGLMGATLYYVYSMDANIKEIIIPLIQSIKEPVATVVTGG